MGSDSDSNPATIDPGQVRCPTCRASQAWSVACRRCKSDLRLLRACAATYLRARRACLEALTRGDGHAAASLAHHCQTLDPGPESRRLRALAALLQGDWPAAAQLARLDD